MKSVSFLFEIMKGCQMGCAGCRVRKESTDIPSDGSLDKLIDMFGDLKNVYKVDLNEIEIGPSDIFSAQNKQEIFSNPKLKKLVDLFQTMSINASFIYPDIERYRWLADACRRFECSEKLGVIIPIEMEQVFHPKYMGRIKDNLQRFYEFHDDRRYRTTLNIIYDERFVKNPVNKFSYEELFQRTNGFVNDLFFAHCKVRVDFVFHHGRDNLDLPWVADSFRTSLDDLYAHYFKDHEKNKGALIDGIPSFLNFDFENDELIYHDEKLYVRPILNDRCNIFHEQLQHKGEWSAVGMMTGLADRFNNNLEMASQMRECHNCSRIVDCAKRYTHDVLRILKTEDCLPLLKQYEK